jgi:hypothetical protein
MGMKRVETIDDVIQQFHEWVDNNVLEALNFAETALGYNITHLPGNDDVVMVEEV